MIKNEEEYKPLDLKDAVFNKRPSMMELRQLKLPKVSHDNEKSFDIAERVGLSYKKVGGELLEDSSGNKVEIIWTDNYQKVVDTNVAILKEWLKGSGKRPVNWRTLIQVLENHGQVELAQDITKALLYSRN